MQIKKLDNICVVELANRIDVSSSPELEKVFNQLLDQGHDAILCDFSQTEYISSMGLRVFLSTLKRSVKTGGQLSLCCLKPGVMEIFDMTGLTELFQIFDSSAAALAAFPARVSQDNAPSLRKDEEDHPGVMIEKPPQEVVLAYSIRPKQICMDEKI